MPHPMCMFVGLACKPGPLGGECGHYRILCVCVLGLTCKPGPVGGGARAQGRPREPRRSTLRSVRATASGGVDGEDDVDDGADGESEPGSAGGGGATVTVDIGLQCTPWAGNCGGAGLRVACKL